MDKKLINNLTEYREWAWQTYQDWEQNEYIEKAFGLIPIWEVPFYADELYGLADELETLK